MFIINPEGKVIYEGAIDSKRLAESGRHSDFDQLREGRSRRSDGGQENQQAHHASVRLLGEILKVILH